MTEELAQEAADLLRQAVQLLLTGNDGSEDPLPDEVVAFVADAGACVADIESHL